MNTAPEFADAIRHTLRNPTRGVIGVVEDVLALCGEYGLQLDWQAGRCRVRPPGGDLQEVLDVPLRKSVFRAILARIAALCNERAPKSVSPYGGQGQLSVGANPPALFRVVFVNTPAEQRLELAPELVADNPQQSGRFEKSAHPGTVLTPVPRERLPGSPLAAPRRAPGIPRQGAGGGEGQGDT